ncbi:unnamed protein product [Knipowitschia caucasica]
MAQIGKVDEFKPENEPWTAYVERLEQFFDANDIDQGKYVAVLLSVMGATTYGLLRNLVQPDKPKDKSFADIVTILKEHFEPKPILVAERFRFNKCNQKQNQYAQYVAELKQQATNCEFGANLDSALRDRFVPVGSKMKRAKEDCSLKIDSHLQKLLRSRSTWKLQIGTHDS